MSANKKLALALSASLTAATVLPIMPAAAQPLRLAPTVQAQSQVDVLPVQYRRPPPGWGRPGWRPPPRAWGPGRYRPGWGWYRPGAGWGYYDNSGAWIAAGVAGLALGAAAAAAASNNAAVDRDAIAYCSRRFKSYDPNTGTYLGYDGFRHPCP